MYLLKQDAITGASDVHNDPAFCADGRELLGGQCGGGVIRNLKESRQ